jgi:radical SAM superfamily enzyme YgiQ (UPF0313 family)
MPHAALVAFTGFRIREGAMRELGMDLPGLAPRAKTVAQLPALGLLTLAGLTPPNWEVSYHEASGEGDTESLANQIIELRPTLVGVSALTASVEEAYTFSRLVRASGVQVVIGGLHATACPDEATRHCDSVIIGDGEPVWLAVLTEAQRRSLAPFYRAARPFDLSDAPQPRFDLLGDAGRPRYTVQTQRGCPLACDFCAASRLLGPFREKPAAKIAVELQAIRARSPRPVVELADDNTFAGPRRVGLLFEALADSGARYFTEADWRIGERPDVLDGLAASGCVQVLVGIEAIEPRFSGMGPKSAELSRVLDAVEAIQATGVAVIGCFVVGSDCETAETMDCLGVLLEEATLADIQLTLQTPFPGTALYRRLARSGRLLPDRGWSHYTLFDVVYRPKRLTVEDLEARFADLVRRAFSADAARRRSAIRRAVWASNPALHRHGAIGPWPPRW